MLAHQLSNKWGDDYSVVMGWLRCCLSFSLLRSSIQCIRGARSSIGHYVKTPPIVELIRAELQSLSLPWTKKVPVCPAQAIYVLGVVGKGSPSSPVKKKKKKKPTLTLLFASPKVECSAGKTTRRVPKVEC